MGYSQFQHICLLEKYLSQGKNKKFDWRKLADTTFNKQSRLTSITRKIYQHPVLAHMRYQGHILSAVFLLIMNILNKILRKKSDKHKLKNILQNDPNVDP